MEKALRYLRQVDLLARDVDEKVVAFIVVEKCFYLIDIVVYEFLPEKHEQTVYLLGTLLLQLGNFGTQK